MRTWTNKKKSKSAKSDPNEPNFQDRVKNKITNVTGVVIAKYPGLKDSEKVNLLDIRLDNEDKIWYESPANKWEIIKRYSEE